MQWIPSEKMTEREALKIALETLKKIQEGCGNVIEDELHAEAVSLAKLVRKDCDKLIDAIREALAQPKPVQVSPLDFVTMTLEKEHLVGRPIIWAQWPNEEKNT